jgi:hypothetical protein
MTGNIGTPSAYVNFIIALWERAARRALFARYWRAG